MTEEIKKKSLEASFAFVVPIKSTGTTEGGGGGERKKKSKRIYRTSQNRTIYVYLESLL